MLQPQCMVSAYKYDGKGVKFVGERHEQKISSDSSKLHHEVMSLHEDFKGSPERSDTMPFIAK